MKKIKALVAAAILVASTNSFAAPVFADTITNTNNTIAIEDTIVLEDTAEVSEIDTQKIDISKLEVKDTVEAKDGKGYKLTFDYSYGDLERFVVNNKYSDMYGKSLNEHLQSFGSALVRDSGNSMYPKIEANLIFDSGLSSLYSMTYFVVEKEPGLFGKHYIQPYTIELNKDKKEGIDNQVPAYNINLSDKAAMERLKKQLGDAVQNQDYKVEHDNTAINGVYTVKITKDGVTVAMLNLYEETVEYSTHVQNKGEVLNLSLFLHIIRYFFPI